LKKKEKEKEEGEAYPASSFPWGARIDRKEKKKKGGTVTEFLPVSHSEK